jgi:ribosomal protein S18 acetylase RimI-like enzyme
VRTKRDSRASAIIIRTLEERDFESVLLLFDAVAAEQRWIGTEPGFDRERHRARWRTQLDGENAAAYVAIHRGRVVGYVGTYPHDEYGLILGILVHERFRGMGIGAKLLDKAIEWARDRKLPAISLLVFAHNERAIALYRTRGFDQREYFERDVTRQTGEVWDTILMTKTLFPN